MVFVPDTAPGDRARVRLRRVRRRFAEGRLESVLAPGRGRVTPPCPYVPRCGGCRLQHVDRDTALDAKRAQVVEHLARIGHLEGIDVRPPDPALEPFRYRNKMEYSAAPEAGGGLRLGFHARGRWDEVVDVGACLLATERGDAVRETVRAWALEEGLRPYDQRAGEGVLRHVVVREGILTDQVLVTVVTAPGAEAAVERLPAPLLAAHPEVVGVRHAVNDGVAEVASGLPARLVAGRDWFEERVGDRVLRLSAEAFFQTNSRMTARLYDRVAEAAGLSGGEVLYDLFAGVGSIGVVLGRPGPGGGGRRGDAPGRGRRRAQRPRQRPRAATGRSAATWAACSASTAPSCRRPTSPWSTRRAPAWPGGPCGACSSWRRPSWSTCRATRRRWPRTPAPWWTVGTGWSGSSRSTCSRRPRTSRPSRASCAGPPRRAASSARTPASAGPSPGRRPSSRRTPRRRGRCGRTRRTGVWLHSGVPNWKSPT